MLAFGQDAGFDYDAVRVTGSRYVPWQPRNMAITPNGWIYYPADPGDLGSASFAQAALLVHEMAHAWQFQHREGVFWRGLALQVAHYGSLRAYDPYALPPGPWAYHSLNLEQQAQFVTRTLFPDRVWYRI